MAHITVSDLSKTYRVVERPAGLAASLRSLVRRSYREVEAVRGISFSVEAGEMVGFIGPNGAGKTTTLKMLAGLLYPSSGRAAVEGFAPWERQTEYLRRISMVMGNRNQLAWDNTTMDSFIILGEIYRVPRTQFRQTLDELVQLLDLQPLLPKPPRSLSLGERMRCEMAAALLHRPSVLFLDEPTLGLDVSMQFRLRRFVTDYNRRHGATIMLTSHYMADVVSLCRRVILIHHGRLLFDGELSRLAARMAPFKVVSLRLGEGNGADIASVLEELGTSATVLHQGDRQCSLRVRREEASAVTARVLSSLPHADITVEDPPIDAVIDEVYREGVAA